MRRRSLRAALVGGLTAAAVAGAGAAGAAGAGPSASIAAAAPPAGHYAATLCVNRAAEAPGCGPAELDIGAGGRLRVQVSDIVYRLRINASQAAVIVTQGAMQLDEFDSGAEWSGPSLHFDDARKHLHYEVRVGPPKRLPK